MDSTERVTMMRVEVVVGEEEGEEDRVRVRLGAVRGAGAVFGAGGEATLLLLPEALPFLSETQHDDDPRVEAATHALIAHLQTASGEDLGKYLA